jgi:hypothetical protein
MQNIKQQPQVKHVCNVQQGLNGLSNLALQQLLALLTRLHTADAAHV